MKKYFSILILIIIAGNTFGQEEYESKSFKNWIPAIRLGKKVNSYEFISISFGDKTIKRKKKNSKNKPK